MTAAVAAIGCVITAGGLPIGQVTSPAPAETSRWATSNQRASALHCTLSKGSHSGVSCPVFFTISHFEAFSLPVQDSVQFYLPHTQQSVDGRISSEPAWLVTVKDEKCLVYCECKQCEMGNPAYLWNAVLCRHEEHSSPCRGTSHWWRWRGDIGSSLDAGQQTPSDGPQH